MRVAAIGLSVVLVSGCVPSEFYVKQGVTYDRYERDGVACATAATQAVPTNTQVTWAPYVGIYSVDTNAPLRDKNMEICMRDRGYQEGAGPLLHRPRAESRDRGSQAAKVARQHDGGWGIVLLCQ